VDPFTAFDERLDRMLRNFLRDAAQEFDRIYVETTPLDAARVQRQLDALEDEMHRATNVALGEANRLPGPASIRREETAPRLASKLGDHLRALYQRDWRLAGAPDRLGEFVAAEQARLEGGLAAEMRDYGAGVWQPLTVVRSTMSFPVESTGSVAADSAAPVESMSGIAAALSAPVESLGPTGRPSQVGMSDTDKDLQAASIHELGPASPNAIEATAGKVTPEVSVALTGVSAKAEAGHIGAEGSSLRGVEARGEVGSFVSPATGQAHGVGRSVGEGESVADATGSAAGAATVEATRQGNTEQIHGQVDSVELPPGQVLQNTVALSGHMSVGAGGRATLSTSPNNTLAFSAATSAIPVPPEIPGPAPAALAPVWVDGVLSLPPAPAESDLGGELPILFTALRADLEVLAADLAAEGDGNLDARLVGLVRGLVDFVPPGGPDRATIYRLGHRVEELQECGAQVQDEWPVPLAGRYRALITRLQRVLSHFPAWHRFTADTEAQALTDDTVMAAAAFAHAITDALITDQALAFIDISVPTALEQLASQHDLTPIPGHLPQVITPATKRWAFDLIQSTGNILKSIGELAKKYGQEFVGGMDDQAKVRSRRAGADLIDFAITLAQGTGGLALTVASPHLFWWLLPLLAFLEFAKKFR